MDEKQAKIIKRRLTIIGGAVLVAVVVYMLVSAFVLKRLGPEYPVVIGAGIIVFWLLQDIAAPILTKEFAGKTREQMAAYKFYAVLSLVGYLGLVFFAGAPNQQYGFYGAIVYAVAVMIKRRFLDDYRGINEEDDQDSDQQDETGTLDENAGESEAEQAGVLTDSVAAQASEPLPPARTLAEKLQRFAMAEEADDTAAEEADDAVAGAADDTAAEEADDAETAETAEDADHADAAGEEHAPDEP